MGPDVAADPEVGRARPDRALDFLGRHRAQPGIRRVTGVDPDFVFAAAAHRPYPAYLWGHPAYDKGRYSIVAHSPLAVLYSDGEQSRLVCDDRTLVVAEEGLSLAVRLAAACGVEEHAGLPFTGGAIGYVSYEYALRFLGLPPARGPRPLPDCHFAFYDRAFVYDHTTAAGYWIGPPGDVQTETPPDTTRLTAPWTASVDRPTYLAHVERILEHIARGDIYQANYTVAFRAPGEAAPAGLALRLKRRIPTPLGAFLKGPYGAIWSVSPERLLAGGPDGRMESRPIKGTRPRGIDPAIDRALAAELVGDPKERAELLMIVDLVRNDLGRVARYGSVRVDELFGLSSYPNVHHLETIVSARRPDHVGWDAVLKAVLPGGSVTGAPKRRAVEILRSLEPVPRGVYTGALGYLSGHGHADFNLPIRTLYHDGRTFHLHAGGGIVADSLPEREFSEAHLKVDHIRALLNTS